MRQVFIIADVPLTDSQFKRLKEQLDEQWEKENPSSPRPLLLESGLRVQVEEV